MNIDILNIKFKRKYIKISVWFIVLFLIQQISVHGISINKGLFLNLFSCSYIASLLSLIYISRDSKLLVLLSLSCFIYFYQAPFLDYFSTDLSIPKYEIEVSNSTYKKLLSIYSFIILICYGIIRILLNQSFEIDKHFKAFKNSELTNSLFYTALFLTIIYIGLTVKTAGGIIEYLTLNKLEASRAQVFFLLDFKKISVFAVIFGLLSKNKFIYYFTFLIIITLCSIEILSAKRFFVLMILIIVFLIKAKNLKLIYIPILYFGIFLMTLLKFTYYNIRLFALGQIEFSNIFWFDWKVVFIDTFLIGEGQGHILQFAHYLQYNINFEPYYFIKLLLVSLPFGHQLVPNYQTAGAFLQSTYNISWGGLASSLYLTPYLSLGILGVVLIYLIYFILVSMSMYLFRMKSLFVKSLLFANYPIIFFYFQREELIVIGKNFSIHAAALFLIFVIAYLFKYIFNVFQGKTELPPSGSKWVKKTTKSYFK